MPPSFIKGSSASCGLIHTIEKAKENSFMPFAALLGVQALFGSLPVIAKVVLASVPAMSLVGLRVAITAIVLLAVQAFRGRIRLKERHDYLRLAVLSIFGVTLNQLFFIGGLARTTASNTSLLAVTIPIFAITVGVIAGTERLRIAKAAGILIAMAGVLLIIDPRNASFSSDTTRGDLMIIFNSFCFGTYVATSKNVVLRNGPFRSMMWVFIFAAVVCVPLGVSAFAEAAPAAISTKVWMLVLYIGIGATAVPYLLNAWAIQHVDPSTLAIFIYLQPIIGVLLAAVFLGERLRPSFLLATALIFAGVALVTRKFVPSET